MLNEVETQTESDVESTLSIENDTLRSRNESLERIAELKERLKQEVAPSGGNILTNVACTALFPEEKYFPVGSDFKDQTIKEFKEGMARKINQLEQQESTITKLKQEINDNKFLLEQKAVQVKAKESQKNELNTTIVQLRGNIDVSEKKLNIHLSNLKNMQVERDDLKAENDRLKTELKKFSQLEESYTLRGHVIENKKIEINKMDKELKQKEIQMNSLQKEVGDVTRKLKNELSLESVNVQNGKTRINELEHAVTQLQNKLEDVKRVKEELENRQLLVTQEKTNLESGMEELVNKYENISTINSKILEHLYKFYSLFDLMFKNGENNIFMFYVIIMKTKVLFPQT
jgi:chromosome segregation ATPase